MNHCPIETELVLYAAGELPDAGRRDLQEHLAGCDACRREVRSLGRGFEALEALSREPALRPEAAARFERRLGQAVTAAENAAPARPAVIRLAWQFRWVAAAAAVLVVGFLAWRTIEPARTTPAQTPREVIEEISVALDLLESDDQQAQAIARPAPAAWDDDALDEIKIQLEQIASEESFRS
jgi:anti-sigma-K factor RskA